MSSPNLRAPRLRSLKGASLLVVIIAALVANHALVNGPGLTAAPFTIAVRGNHLVDGSGNVITLHGVDISGTEWACESGGIFVAPSDDAAISAIAAWHANAVRIPLNEDCWLGINGMGNTTAFRAGIEAYVARLHAHGLYAIIDLHWSAAGGIRSTGQQQMADADHAPAFWQSVATTFKNDHADLFDLYNEPHDVSWSCWRSGCGSAGFQTAGMQQLVDAVRSTGATEPVMVGGLGWASQIGQSWLDNRPSDSASQLVASVHEYSQTDVNYFSSNIGTVATQFPVVTGEFGQMDCGNASTATFMQWADQHGVSYIAWAWFTGGCGYPAVITDYNGTPSAEGLKIHDHFVATFPAPTPGGSPPPPTATPQPTSQPSATAQPTATAHPTATAQPTPQPTAQPTPGPTAGGGAGSIAIKQSCAVSAPSVAIGDTLTATGELTNAGGQAVTLTRVVLAGRPPGGSNSGGPYLDFAPSGSAISIAPGASYHLTASRTFASGSPLGSWFCYLTYETANGSWHDDMHDMVFSVTAAGTSAHLVFTGSCSLPTNSVSVGGTLTATARLTNDGGQPITVPLIVIAGRPPGGSNSGGPYLDFGGSSNVTIAPGASIELSESRTFAAGSATGTWYCYLTYETQDGTWHDDAHDTYFAVR